MVQGVLLLTQPNYSTSQPPSGEREKSGAEELGLKNKECGKHHTKSK